MYPLLGERWRVLIAVCCMLWGIYFVYDIPAALSVSLQKHLSLLDSQYAYLVSMLYSAYSVPNTVLPLLSGFAVQRYGEKRILGVTLICIVSGQLVFSAAIQLKYEALMVFGRLLIGLGGEVVSVIAGDITTRWFKNNQLTLALAVTFCMAKIGSVANSNTTPRFVEAYGIVPAVWAVTVISLAVLILGTLYLLSRSDESSHKKKEQINYLESIRKLSSIYWQLTIICILGYGGINTFTNSAQRFLASQYYAGDQSASGSAIGIFFLLSSILMLPFGFLLEIPRFSDKPRSLIASNMMISLAHLALLFHILGVILPLCILGTAYALYDVALWAGIASTISSEDSTDSRRRAMLFRLNDRGTASTESQIEPAYDVLATVDDDLDSNLENSIEEMVNPDHVEDPAVEDDHMVAIGYGIATSFLNMSSAVVSVILAAMENIAGFPGIEISFAVLGGCGCLVSINLARMWKTPS
ncbi:major facilitator superfamily domain-containing protein [Xylogone sp. PMI_703]|nr:major facilitator superfamily domain-containing protein [Xylogone sp. PMI_703]